MPLHLSIEGAAVLRRVGSGAVVALSGIGEASALEGLRDWAVRYGRAVRSRSEGLILQVGAEMFAWLDQGGGLAGWLQDTTREFEVVVEPDRDGALTDALLAAPWEVLAKDGSFLAGDLKLFSVARRCAPAKASCWSG